MQVQTVRGSVDAAALGRTYMHEHIFALTTDIQLNYPEEWGSEEARIDDAADKLRALASQGINTIVDLTVIGLGRYIPRIKIVAEKVPELNIVVATGIYTYDSVPNYFKFRHAPKGTNDPMVDLFISDIEEGITGTGVKAGMLKCAIDSKGLTPGVERVMRAVGKTHVRTGVPVTVHTHPATKSGFFVKKVLCDEEGVDPSKVVLAHCGDTSDCDHLSQLADMGFSLGMDRFGIYVGLSFEERCETVIEMCRRGYAERMVLSHDAAAYIDWLDQRALRSLPQWNYNHIVDDVLPYLLSRGVSEQQIDAMLKDTPRRLLSDR